MAFPWAEINGYANEFFLEEPTDAIYKGNVLASRMGTNGRINVDGGRAINLPVEFAKANGGNYDGAYDIINATVKKTHDYGTLDWKFKWAETVISDKDILMNSGSSKIRDLVRDKVLSMKSKIRDLIGTGIYSAGTDTTEIDGLGLSVDTGNTYAGIAQGTYTWWKAAGEDSSSTTITIPLLTTAFFDTVANSPDQETPTVWTTTATIMAAVSLLAQPQQRFMGDNCNVGFPSLAVMGIPMILDSKCTASHLYLLNEKYLGLTVASNFNMTFTGFETPINQPSARIAISKWGGNLLNRLPGTMYKFSALTA